jgi:hypothetical protein
LVQKKKKKQTYVLLILAKCVFATTKFWFVHVQTGT